MILVITTVLLVMIQNIENDKLFIIPVSNAYQADVITKKLKYNPRAEVIRQYRVDLMEATIDSTGSVIAIAFIPIPKSSFAAHKRMSIEKVIELGGYVGETKKRYTRRE